jgi:hypothetical protein
LPFFRKPGWFFILPFLPNYPIYFCHFDFAIFDFAITRKGGARMEHRRTTMKKQEAIEAIVACTEKLGRVPSTPELMKHAGINRAELRKHFGNYRQALEECRLEAPEWNRRVEIAQLFPDWAGVVRKLRKLPTIFEYERQGKYTARPMRARFGTWSRVPEGMMLYAETHGLAGEWPDVLELIKTQAGGQDGDARVSTARADRAVYGPRIWSNAMAYGPMNENGVICLFGSLAEQLGFLILRIQTEFPDCEAMRAIEEDRLQPVRIEFEYESRNFLKHMHEPAGCDLIVCWEHNWPECPVEVIELKEAVSRQHKL